jgi:hypothetical protein
MIKVVDAHSPIGAEVPGPIIFQKEDLSKSAEVIMIAEDLEFLEFLQFLEL